MDDSEPRRLLIHVVRGRPGGLLQFSKCEAVKIFLASVSSDIRAMWANRDKGCSVTLAESCQKAVDLCSEREYPGKYNAGDRTYRILRVVPVFVSFVYYFVLKLKCRTAYIVLQCFDTYV